ncbi:hypothetical protein [Salinimonas sediminis]|uniref:hypothetical protein n=1 Tax=Salinimonas sediminis TaxID=2303538 RepID=UPI001474DC44|nr:hypothetical protein [Salinimonas sediminis]
MTTSKKPTTERKEKMKDEDAEASAPEQSSIAGEEDPGAALEDWVTRDERTRRKPENK